MAPAHRAGTEPARRPTTTPRSMTAPMVAARSTEPEGRTRITRRVSRIVPSSARQRRGTTPRAARPRPRTMATCCPETAVKWVMDTVRMSWRTWAGRAWSSPRATPGTRVRAPGGQNPRDAVSVPCASSAPTARARPVRMLVTAPSTPAGGLSTLRPARLGMMAVSDRPGCVGFRCVRTSTQVPMGRLSHCLSARTVALRDEDRPSTCSTSRAVMTRVDRLVAETLGSWETVPTRVTGRPEATAMVRGSRWRAHRWAALMARTAAAHRAHTSMLALTVPMAPGSCSGAPGRGSARWRGGRKRRTGTISAAARAAHPEASRSTGLQAPAPSCPTAHQALAQQLIAGVSRRRSRGSGALEAVACARRPRPRRWLCSWRRRS